MTWGPSSKEAVPASAAHSGRIGSPPPPRQFLFYDKITPNGSDQNGPGVRRSGPARELTHRSFKRFPRRASSAPGCSAQGSPSWQAVRGRSGVESDTLLPFMSSKPSAAPTLSVPVAEVKRRQSTRAGVCPEHVLPSPQQRQPRWTRRERLPPSLASASGKAARPRQSRPRLHRWKSRARITQGAVSE